MPGFDDSFLYDCGSFERTGRMARHRIRTLHGVAGAGAILKSANSVNPDPFLADGGGPGQEDDAEHLSRKPPRHPSSEGVRQQEKKKKKSVAGNVLEFLGSPRFGRRSVSASPRTKLFGGANSTYDVLLSERQSRREQLLQSQQKQPRTPSDDRSYYKRYSDVFDEDEPSMGDGGEASGLVGSFEQTSYDTSSICHPTTTTPGATSTPISSGRNSSASGSNGASSNSSLAATGGGTTTTGGNDSNSGNSSNTVTTPGAPGSSGHKGSIRGNKLARRARSFKDDFLEKISQIRTPTSTMTRSHSPNSPRGGGSGGAGGSYGSRKSTTDEPAKPVQDLNYHVRQVKNALTHFKDVILKNKLEMLPGNGTVVLESIANVHTALQSYTLNEHSTAFINATNRVHVSLGNLLKLCDEVLLTKDGDDCPSLSKENVKEVVELVENAINNLVNLANEKISDKKPLTANSGGGGTGPLGCTSSNTLQRPTVDVVSQRTSLPDIPLTPRERDILEQTSLKTVRASHSTESILRDSSPPPPPKPPLPDRSSEPPPPLPPKRKGHHAKNHSFHDTTATSAMMMMASSSDCCHSDSTFHLHGGAGGSVGGGVGGGGGSGSIAIDRMSLRSRSPEDNSSLLSASAGSLDSALNHSREEDELRALSGASVAAGMSMIVASGGGSAVISGNQPWEAEPSPATITMTMTSTAAAALDTMVAAAVGQNSSSQNRNSNESGFESMYSLRVSREHQLQHQHHLHQLHQISASSQSSSSASSYVHKSESVVDGLNELKCSSVVLASATKTVQQQQHLHQKIDTIITQASDEGASALSSGALAKQLLVHHGPTGSIDELLLGSDDVFPRAPASSDRPPALPVKTRSHSIKRERHPSQYDNVDDMDAERSSQDAFVHFPMHSSPSYLSQGRQQMFNNLPSKHISLIEPRHMMNRFQEEPPPLPIKKKHIMAYMEIFGSATQNHSEFMRHSVHTYNLAHSEQVSSTTTTTNHSISHSQTMSLSPSRMAPVSVSPPSSPNVSVKPPALPPKRQRINSKTPSIASTPPASPKIFQDQQQFHHHQHHQFPQQPTSALNTSPSPSTASLTSSHSGGGGGAFRAVPAICNQTLDVKTPKVSLGGVGGGGGGSGITSGHLEPAVAALSLHGSVAATANAAAATTTTTNTLSGVGSATAAGASGPVAAAGTAVPYGNIGQRPERSRSPCFSLEGESTATNKLPASTPGDGAGAQQLHYAEEDYLLLSDATTRRNSSAPLTANAPPSANLPCSASQTNLKSTINSAEGGGLGNNANSLVNSGSGGTRSSHSHSDNNNGGSSSNIEPSSYLNDSRHNKGSSRHGSSSGAKLVLAPSGETIYESCPSGASNPPASSNNDEHNSGKDGVEVEVILRRNNKNGMTIIDQQPPLNLMEELDVSSFLVFKKDNEDGPDVKGGHPDALIIHATRVQKNSDAYGEAFITTFRTFISPLELIQKLSHRYTVYHCQMNDAKQKAAKESFSLLVRVVNDLTTPDLSERLLVILMNFDYQLVSAGHLNMAKVLRVKVIEKALVYKQKASLVVQSISSRPLMASPPTLLDLKSAEIAEQMTLLDAELFQKIEIPEVLIWAQEQCEERSPNLTRFTEHFNKMSYWARTQILSQNDAKDREKHVIKFIKIMKHLRKINNYNSYLALLSALDSAPIRRLEWHKTITEGLKEYCALIDSSSSFRAYRQALAETSPPCIPYIGLVLQDLTFVHIGNPDLLTDGSTNFSKRWQQYHIVVNMKRFRKGLYPFKKNERIIGFFDNFDHYLDEDAMWQISETIKPRGTRKTNVN